MLFRSKSQLGFFNKLKSFFNKLYMLWDFYVGVSFTLPLIILPFLLKNRWVFFTALSCLILVLQILSKPIVAICTGDKVLATQGTIP